MTRIRLTIDYTPVLADYPPHVTNKREAMEFDKDLTVSGVTPEAALIEFAEDHDIAAAEDLRDRLTAAIDYAREKR